MDILLSSGLKDNAHLAYGFLSGVMSIARWKELTGLNNIIETSILDNRYSDYFGFTQEEVQTMLDYYEATEKYGGRALIRSEPYGKDDAYEYI